MGLDLEVGRRVTCATCLPGLVQSFSALIHNENVVSEGSRSSRLEEPQVLPSWELTITGLVYEESICLKLLTSS